MTFRSLVILVLAAGLCGFDACESTVRVPSFDDENFDPMAGFDVDPSNDIASAFSIAPEDLGVGAATAGTVFTESIYPKFDDDFWRVEVSEPGQLIQVRVEYKKNASPIRLAIDWIGPRDLCTPATMTSCTFSSECGGMMCDDSRGGCRAAQADPCAGDNHCGASESCRRGAEDPIATVLEADGTMQHLVMTTLPAHVTGDYYIRVYDRDSVEGDANTKYELQVGILPDPDLTEMNDAPNMATPLTNGATINGFFSYDGDVDYYRIDPGPDAGVSSPAVTSVEVRWPSGSDSKPIWTIEQADRQFLSTKLPRIQGTDNVHGGTFVLGNAEPIFIKVENPDGRLDVNRGYELSINVIEDTDEGNNRNDIAQNATAVDMTSFGTAHNAAHTIIAENDLDWYRIDRSSGISDNSLMYMRARATSDDIMMSVLVFEAVPNMSCDPSTQLLCGGGQHCVCPFSGSCGAGQGACIKPWVTRPLVNDPNHPPEFGGKTPNDIQLQLPIFDAGSGALWVQVGHLQQVYPPRAGHSATDSYSLTFEHRQEPHVFDRDAGKNEFQPLPLGVSEGTWVSNRRVEGTFSLGQTVSGYISYEGDQDWFRFTTSAPVGMADLQFTNTAGINLRVQVRRGSNKVGTNGDMNADSVCSHMYSGDSTIDVWVNDNDFDQYNINTPYSFVLDIVPGCIEPQCHVCRCRPDQGCGCGEPPPDECGTCDGSIVDLGCGCGNPADQGCGCGNPGPVDGSC